MSRANKDVRVPLADVDVDGAVNAACASANAALTVSTRNTLP
jgi:hypothetical protein